MTLYCITIIILENHYMPDNHLTMKALVTLEWGVDIPVLKSLQSKLSDLQHKINLTPTQQRSYSGGYSDSSAVIRYIGNWINSSGHVIDPTWRNFFKILRETSPELGQLAYQIKEIFHGTYLFVIKSSCITTFCSIYLLLCYSNKSR